MRELWAPMTSRKEDLVPVAPLREAFERSGLRACDVAHALGWVRRGGGSADTQRVRRSLGLAHYTSTRTRADGSRSSWRAVNERIGYEHAVRFAAAMGVDPVEVGL